MGSRLVLVATVGLAALAVAGCGGGSGSKSAVTTTAASTDTTPNPQDFSDIVARVRSGVVRVEVKTCGAPSVGSGFLVGPRLVATVQHVIDGATRITLRQGNGRTAVGTVIGADSIRDLAVIRTDRPLGGYVFRLEDEVPRLGEEVGAIGFPLGLPLTVTKGSVSGLNRSIKIGGITRRKLVQTDAALNPGNSGGPLISLASGKVVGLVDAGAAGANGISFAVNSKTARALIEAWRAAPQPIALRRCSRPAARGSATQVSRASSRDLFQSPSGNIRCAYEDQVGVACVTLNDGLGAVLRSFDTSYPIDDPYSFTPPPGRTIPYGQTWSLSSFRCASRTDGMKCWSTVTGHGFFISRDSRELF